MRITAFKSDRFRKSRGGHSRWLLLSCESCKTELAVYQKDGPGILKRIYLDRIMSPNGLSQNAKANLACTKCEKVLGIRTVFQKEDRPAYRLFVGAVAKKIIRSDKLHDIAIWFIISV